MADIDTTPPPDPCSCDEARALRAEIERLTAEIADAREACPVIAESRLAQQDKLIADLDTLLKAGGIKDLAFHVGQVHGLVEEVARLTAELADWTRYGIIEVAIRNPNVQSYVDHWEARTLQAERERDAAQAALADLRARLTARAKDWQRTAGVDASAVDFEHLNTLMPTQILLSACASLLLSLAQEPTR